MALKKQKGGQYTKYSPSTLQNSKKLPKGYIGVINQVLKMKTNNKSKQKISGGKKTK